MQEHPTAYNPFGNKSALSTVTGNDWNVGEYHVFNPRWWDKILFKLSHQHCPYADEKTVEFFLSVGHHNLYWTWIGEPEKWAANDFALIDTESGR